MVVGFAEVGSEKSQSPAQQAGLECGDIILAVNETEIDSNESLMDALSVLDVYKRQLLNRPGN